MLQSSRWVVSPSLRRDWSKVRFERAFFHCLYICVTQYSSSPILSVSRRPKTLGRAEELSAPEYTQYLSAGEFNRFHSRKFLYLRTEGCTITALLLLEIPTSLAQASIALLFCFYILTFMLYIATRFSLKACPDKYYSNSVSLVHHPGTNSNFSYAGT